MKEKIKNTKFIKPSHKIINNVTAEEISEPEIIKKSLFALPGNIFDEHSILLCFIGALSSEYVLPVNNKTRNAIHKNFFIN